MHGVRVFFRTRRSEQARVGGCRAHCWTPEAPEPVHRVRRCRAGGASGRRQRGGRARTARESGARAADALAGRVRRSVDGCCDVNGDRAVATAPPSDASTRRESTWRRADLDEPSAVPSLDASTHGLAGRPEGVEPRACCRDGPATCRGAAKDRIEKEALCGEHEVAMQRVFASIRVRSAKAQPSHEVSPTRTFLGLRWANP